MDVLGTRLDGLCLLLLLLLLLLLGHITFINSIDCFPFEFWVYPRSSV
jgi:hypothetical protein